MANIQERTGKRGRSYRVQVRRLGHPPLTKTFKRKTDAEAWARQIESSLDRGEAVPTNEARKRTVGELIDRFLEREERRKPHAYAKLAQILGWWKAQIGAYSLTAATPAVIAKARDDLLREKIGKAAPKARSAATANRYLATLSSAFSAGVKEWHWLPDNPVLRVSKEVEPQGRIRYLSESEKTALLAACARSRLPELELIVLLALTTGMRRGEILGLRWADIDLARGQAVLHKTKNHDRRAVPLVPQVLEKLKPRVGESTDLVFGQAENDRPVDIDYSFRVALKEAEIEDFRFHDLRHTAASYLAMSGATPAEIAAVLGHRTLQMVKRYAHLSDAHTGAVVERMARKFFAGPRTRSV